MIGIYKITEKANPQNFYIGQSNVWGRSYQNLPIYKKAQKKWINT